MPCDHRNKCQSNDKHALNICTYNIVNRQVEGHIRMGCKMEYGKPSTTDLYIVAIII